MKHLAINKLLLLLPFLVVANQVSGQSYDFRNVTIGGGGYVTGLVFHPQEQDLLYVRTDVGGAYRWNASANEWTQLMLSVPEYGNVDGLAIAESNPDMLFLACGNSSDQNPEAFDVLKSTDRGSTWQALGFNNLAGVEQAFEGNQRDVRYTGERIAVDPVNENIVFVGTKLDGLWKSSDGGTSWSKVNSIPNSTVFTYVDRDENPNVGYVGVCNILFDKNFVAGGKTQVIYVGNYEDGIYKSTDAGTTFQKINGSPETARRMDLTPDGSTLWVTTGYPIGGAWGQSGSVYKYANGAWVDQNLATNGPNEPFGALDVHPTDPNRIILTAGNSKAEQRIYRTQDGGANWYLIHYSENNRVKQGQPWWADWLFATGPAAIQFNPFDTDQVWFSSGEGVWKTDNVWNSAPFWTAEVDKLEELVGFVAKAPKSGALVLFGCGDADGFRITDVNSPPQQKFNGLEFSETTDVSIVENNPNHVVRVGGFQWGTWGWGAYSVDNGQDWTPFPAWPGDGKASGKVAVSATSLDKIVTIPLNSLPYYTTNRGITWQESSIADTAIIKQIWQWDQNLEADKVNGEIFYVYNRENGKFYRSENAGQTFDQVNTLAAKPWRQWVSVRTVPAKENEVWVGCSDSGLLKSTDGGDNFTPVFGVDEVISFDFGANPPGKSNPSLYLVGTIHGVRGLYVSEDMGQSFNKINTAQQQITGLGVSDMAPSRSNYGTVYLVLGGWGLWYGEANSNTQPQFTLTVDAPNASVSPAGGSYSAGTVVTLTTTPDDGYAFSHWSGDLSGDQNPQQIIMDGNKSVVAHVVDPSADVPVRIEAENYHAMSGIKTQPTGDMQGGGLNVGYIHPGDWMEYELTVANGGAYQVSFRLAATQANSSFRVESGGEILMTVNVPNTNNYQVYTDVTKTINLVAGNNVLKVVSVGATGWNFNWMDIVASPATSPQQDSLDIVPGSAEFSRRFIVFPNPVDGSKRLTILGEVSTVRVLSLFGVALDTQVYPTAKGVEVDLGSISTGIYLMVVNAQVQKLIVE